MTNKVSANIGHLTLVCEVILSYHGSRIASLEIFDSLHFRLGHVGMSSKEIRFESLRLFMISAHVSNVGLVNQPDFVELLSIDDTKHSITVVFWYFTLFRRYCRDCAIFLILGGNFHCSISGPWTFLY